MMRPNAITAGPPTPPVWYCLLVPPQREIATRGHLIANGVDAFFPSREKRSVVRGRTYVRERPEVTGYVFAQFRQAPQWHILKERRRLISGVLGREGCPAEINVDVIRHLRGLTVEAQKLEEAKRDMLRIRQGDKAIFAEGPLADFVVSIDAIVDGEAILSGLLGFRGRAKLTSLQRIIPTDPAHDFHLLTRRF